MCARTTEKYLAIKLRKTGKTYSEIQGEIPNLSKATLSNWLRGLKLSQEEQARINAGVKSGRDRSRLAASKTISAARIERTRRIEGIAEKEFSHFMRDPLFGIGLAMYWAEGAKRSSGAEIINSDPIILKIVISWTEKFLGVNKNQLKARLYIHRQFVDENLEEYWLKILDLDTAQLRQTIFKETKFPFKKNPDYKGCLRLHLGGVTELRKIFHWQRLLARHLKIT